MWASFLLGELIFGFDLINNISLVALFGGIYEKYLLTGVWKKCILIMKYISLKKGEN
ncbi:MAG: hypothetical protein H6Q66_2436 [Firmicutes bacterium]|nr:hypothetical protein [Bacillota bacterium]